jgi:hypothetical protein
MTLEYATVDGWGATVILDGEEKTQPLGELVDILEARLGSRPGGTEKARRITKTRMN